MILRFSRINIYKKEWNSKIYISFEAQNYYFQGMIAGIRRKMYDAKFRDDCDIKLFEEIKKINVNKFATSNHWIVYNFLDIEDYSKGLYSDGLRKEDNDDEIINEIEKNLIFYKGYENKIDELQKMAQF